MAAEILGVSRVTVWNRMKRFGVKYTRQMAPEEDCGKTSMVSGLTP
jgi:DNA-directed RNA polymerase specialized sigma24 family protein